MAIAGLHHLSSFGPFLDESQHGQRSPRASKLLQMWRGIESEHARNHSFRSGRHSNASDSECLSTVTSLGHRSDNGDDVSQHYDDSENQEYIDSEMDHEENGSIESEQFADMGGIEKGRVRQVFQEWLSVGTKGPSSCGFNLNNHSGQWLGENECERVRIIREWVQMTAQQRNNCDCDAEFGSQIEQARDGLVLDSPKDGARRPIRRLCGRQTLLDLLFRAQNERKRELLGLSDHRPVSRFAHRNRIQSHLRARFLRNMSSIQEGKTMSGAAATELCLLRMRHTVSDLREEFLSKSETSASASVNADSSSSGLNSKDSEPLGRGREVTGIHTAPNLESTKSLQELELNVTESRDLDNGGAEQEMMRCGVESALDIEVQQVEELSDVQYSGPSEQVNSIIINEPSVEAVEANLGVQDEVYNENELVEAYQEQLNAAASTQHATGRVEEAVRSFMEDPSNRWPPELSHRNVEEQDHMEEDWTRQNFEEPIEGWLDMPSGDVIGSLQEDSASQWSPEMPSRYAEEQNWVQESNENWPRSEVVGTVGRIDSFYFSDDDNAYDMELRELVSRGRVSSLLHSGFRESLDRVLQSHAERLAHASDDWELENTSHALQEQHDQEQSHVDLDLTLTRGSERGQSAGTSTFLVESQPFWDVELQSISNQQLGTEWEVISDLRIDMARLHQRMDKMHNMLESCMDMQIELQRSVHQEVSAALNRSVTLQGKIIDTNESQWNHVKNGICCLCCDNKIDSLLYRCGHMCACSMCSKSLVHQRGKCPMCEALVIEAVRAYFVQ